ncbi:MAG: cation-translocating P-type ATPase [Ginsengibacter sp.]
MNNHQRKFIMIISGALLAGAIAIHLLHLDKIIIDILLIAASVIVGYQTVLKAFKFARMKMFSIELLVTIAVVGALIIGEYVESAAVTFLFLFGAFLEGRTLEKARSSLKSLLEMAPLEATIVRHGVRSIVLAEDVEAGDMVLIQSGEKIPVDGKIISGRALVNEAAITGESVPVNKTIDAEVFSGTILDNGYIEVIAEKVGDDTTFSKIIELVEEAQEGKAKTQKFLEKFATVYTPAVVILSIIVWLISGDIHLSLTFLVIACPGALVISAPVSIVAGIGNGAKNGILIKGGEIMEALAKVNAMVFDKTGTLTRGKPEVTAVKTYGISEDELLLMAAEAEVVSEHHLGRTIVKEAEKRELKLIRKPKDVEILKGRGIQVTLNGKELYIGNRKGLLQFNKILSTSIEADAIEQEKRGNTVVVVADNEGILGLISIADQVRTEAAQALHELKANGIERMVMLTGDNRHTANMVARQVGIKNVFAELLPENKVEKVKACMAKGVTLAMVGDGINDAPAIASADVGIAMGVAGSDIAMETADVILMTDRLDKLSYAYQLAKATVRNMKQNMFFAVGIVFLLLIGVLTNHVNLASGMFVHELSVLLVILNAIRLVRYKKKDTAFIENMAIDVVEFETLKYSEIEQETCTN